MLMEAAGASGWPQWPIQSTEYSYSLVVVQHPERCRMAGFGDKDRRALSPPPLVKLIIRDLYVREVPVDDVDIDRFVVTAELFSADEPAAEMNLLLQTSLSTPNSRTKPGRGKHPPTVPVLSTSTSDPSTSSSPTKQITSAVTRNLLGSVVVSGFKLTDLEGELGMGQNSTPVTAVTFSNDFTCWSARRFPGVVESGKLGAHFAEQGIRLPVRKESLQILMDRGSRSSQTSEDAEKGSPEREVK